MDNGTNRVGFRGTWMKDEPDTRNAAAEETQPQQIELNVPQVVVQGITDLRNKIAQIGRYMATAKYARLSHSDKLKTVVEFAELTAIDAGYTEALNIISNIQK